MKFDTPAGQNPIDRMVVIGQPIDPNAVYNATGIRVREYPITLDKHLAHMARVAKPA